MDIKIFTISLTVTSVIDKQPKTRKKFIHYVVNVNRISYNMTCKNVYNTHISG